LTTSTLRFAFTRRKELADVEREAGTPPEIPENRNNDEGGYQEEGEICADEMHVIARR
jgi:hypothetical protein